MSAFGDFIKSSGGSEVLGSLLGLGGGLVMSNQQKQNAKKQSNDAKALAQAQIKAQELAYETAKLQAQQGSVQPKSNTSLYVGLGIGGVVVLGLVVFLAVKKQ
jgi:NhaP-type Na+/H+ or K+/H+ antiporter